MARSPEGAWSINLSNTAAHIGAPVMDWICHTDGSWTFYVSAVAPASAQSIAMGWLERRLEHGTL